MQSDQTEFRRSIECPREDFAERVDGVGVEGGGGGVDVVWDVDGDEVGGDRDGGFGCEGGERGEEVGDEEVGFARGVEEGVAMEAVVGEGGDEGWASGQEAGEAADGHSVRGPGGGSEGGMGSKMCGSDHQGSDRLIRRVAGLQKYRLIAFDVEMNKQSLGGSGKSFTS